MDETPSSQTPDSGLNKLDLTQLQGFSFGTSWQQDKSGAGQRPERRDERPRREGGGDSFAPRRDRRDMRRPAGGSPAGGQRNEADVVRGEQPAGDSAVARPHGEPDRARQDRRGDRRDDTRGPRREGYAPRGDFRGPPREPAGPYISPFFAVTFYPEDNSFKGLADAIRKSCRTFELFYIARTVVEKNDRFVAVVQRINGSEKPRHAADGEAQVTPAPRVKAAPFFISVPDGLPFESEDAAISHVLEKHLGQFFDTAEVDVDAPKGNFQVINRCPLTGVLLAPPNYHRYGQILAQHHAANVRMPFEAYKAKIETVRDPELVAQWLEKMKKATRYTWKAAPAKQTRAAAETEATVEGGAPSEATVSPADTASPVLTFDALEEARQHVLLHTRDRVVRTVEQLRLPGRLLENLPATSEIRRAIEGALAAQRRFPLDTANALRGRLRREHFTIFKKGSKGISYVCAVKRRFRVPGQSFSESLAALIAFVENAPMTKASELPERMLGIPPRAPAVEGVEPAPVPADEVEKISRLKADLRYLVKEGYVTEFVDGALFCPPPMVEARKREIEDSDVDPENFPEAPVAKPVAESAIPAAPSAAEEPAASDASEESAAG